MENFKLKCYKVICRDALMNEYEVGTMTLTLEDAIKCAESSLLEGRQIQAKAIKAFETDKI